MDADIESEFREFVRTRWPTLFRAAYLLTGQHEEAEDLLQAALIKTLGRWRRLEQPEAYVRKVMYFHQVSRWRLLSWGRERSTADLPETADQRDATAQTDLRLSLVAALQHLTAGQRAVVVLRFYHDLPDDEIAGTLGISPGVVRTHSHRALAKLRKLCPELSVAQGDRNEY